MDDELDELYCTIFVDTPLPQQDLVSQIAGVVHGDVRRRTIYAPYMRLADEIATRSRGSGGARNIILHLLFPDQVERIASQRIEGSESSGHRITGRSGFGACCLGGLVAMLWSS